MRKMRRLSLGVLLRESDPFFADVDVNIPVGIIRSFEYQSGGVPTIHVEVEDDRMEARKFYLRSFGHGIPQDGEFVGVYNWGQAPVYLFVKRQPDVQHDDAQPADETHA